MLLTCMYDNIWCIGGAVDDREVKVAVDNSSLPGDPGNLSSRVSVYYVYICMYVWIYNVCIKCVLCVCIYVCMYFVYIDFKRTYVYDIYIYSNNTLYINIYYT